MLTINTELAEAHAVDDSSSQVCDIKWFNLSSSPFEDVSPENKNLFSPSLTVESLSPPCIEEKAVSPILWETPCRTGKVQRASMLRDCYFHELSNNLETATCQALQILKHKTGKVIANKDIANIVDNAINNEVRCSNLSDTQLLEIKERLEKISLQSLSSSSMGETESTE